MINNSRETRIIRRYQKIYQHGKARLKVDMEELSVNQVRNMEELMISVTNN
jgi:hypothetical protein